MAVRAWPILLLATIAAAGCVDPNERTQPDTIGILDEDVMPVDIQVRNNGATWAKIKILATDQSANQTVLLNETVTIGAANVASRQTSLPRGHTLEIIVVETVSDDGMFRIFPGGSCPGKLVWRLETAGEGEPITQSETFCDRGAAP